jgi:FADH2 O2-dependent halogenase
VTPPPSRCDVAIVGSGFAGSLLARILATLGYDVTLLERGTHPRFAIGESSTPLANLSLERIAARYGLSDCYDLAAHGRWLARFPQLRRGLKRGFTYYRHHPGHELDAKERMLVAASPDDAIADSHWLRADVDHHFVREAIAAGVDYRDRVQLTEVLFGSRSARLTGRRGDDAVDVRAEFVIDASGPGGFLATQLGVPSALKRTHTRAGLVFSHFANTQLIADVSPTLSPGPLPYAEDLAAVHHIIDEGWMYSLRFDDGVTSAGFVLSPRGARSLRGAKTPQAKWDALVDRYPTIRAAFADATPLFPIAYLERIQHRLSRATGARWAMLPHAYAFVDPLFSTGIAWGLRAVERLASSFERGRHARRRPSARELSTYDALLSAEADQIDRLVAGAYEAMAHFDLFAAHALIYFATVSFAEVRQRLTPDEGWAWRGFLGVGDPVLGTLPARARSRLLRITRGRGLAGSARERREFGEWVNRYIDPRNIGDFGNPERRNLYPVDLGVLVDSHEKLGMTREEVIDALPRLRGATNKTNTPHPNSPNRAES